jgi:hypothetical protein
MRNYVINGAFDAWAKRSGSSLNDAAWVANRWLAGPGVGGAFDWEIRDFTETAIPGNPRHYLRLKWTAAPTQGENPPSARWTFLENHGLRDARQMHGCFVDVTWWVRLENGTVPIVPIIWHNFTDGNFRIYSGEAYPVRSGKGWHPLTQTIYVPEAWGNDIDNTSYVGMGLDMIQLNGPTIDIACVSAVRKEVALIDPQIERLRAAGQFWN